MGQVENLRRLVLSGKKENLEMVKQLVLSPRLHKARGVLRTCGIRVSDPYVDGSGVSGIIEQMNNQRCCGSQCRGKCQECLQYVCRDHYLPEQGLCTSCGGNDTHHYTIPLTMGMLNRWAREYTPQESQPMMVGLAMKRWLENPEFPRDDE